jgi:integrase/recombinase XerD
MKIDGHGQGKVLSSSELDKLFSWGFQNPRDRCLFAICLHSGCRISEALSLRLADIQDGFITLRKSTTKGKKATRQVPINGKLQDFLDDYLDSTFLHSWLFPGKYDKLTRAAAHLALEKACARCGIKGASTHSFRRTALTRMHNNGVPLRVIQRISGHSSLEMLQRYLEITDEQILEAVEVIGRKSKSVNPDKEKGRRVIY